MRLIRNQGCPMKWKWLAHVGVMTVLACAPAGGGYDAIGSSPTVREVQNTEEFFPDEIGSVWRYSGRTRAETIEQIADVTFVNEVSAIGTSNIKGETVKIFRETNQGNKGPTDGYFRREKTGITYFGSQPTTPFEQQLIPYRVLVFPLTLDGRLRQLDKKNVDMQADLDGDGQNERADVVADMWVVGYSSVSVGAGSFENALQIEATMTITMTLSKDHRVVVSRDKITSWFVRGVGLVKYVEVIEALPTSETRSELTHVSEELESYSLKGSKAGGSL
jgi:hypothetical protein